MPEQKPHQPQDDKVKTNTGNPQYRSEIDVSPVHVGTDTFVRDGELLHISKKSKC
ncbi:MAG: hypothetical protein UU89_C0026G0008 [Parcubacteria group bacterium GW2011_GWC2_42_11]|nr:MAG: hypothetical protein UU89_C0026G0008 [Parcubacteria group bacterium GW2011_GWC2_42_11]